MKDIVGYEGLYAITSCGRVWSYRRNKFLKQFVINSGYVIVGLSKNNVEKKFLVHRLVAEAYLPHDESLCYVNHIDECKTHNFLNNLEWCTAEYNRNYGTVNTRLSQVLKGRTPSRQAFEALSQACSIQVFQYTKDGEFVKAWPSSNVVEQELGIFRGNVSRCCKGQRKTAGGYRWSYIKKGE